MCTLANNLAIEDRGRRDVLNKVDKSAGTHSFGFPPRHCSMNYSLLQSICISEIVKDFTQCIRLTPLDMLQAETQIKMGFIND